MQTIDAPTERTARYAAELWKNMLRSAETEEAALSAFGELLVAAILTPCKRHPTVFENSYLTTDSPPCEALRQAAQAAGLVCDWPKKTRMNVFGDVVRLSQGYAEESVYHYALDDNRWLVTRLHGSDIEQIKQHVLAGTPLDLPIFTSQAAGLDTP